jgi:hypothetical protein
LKEMAVQVMAALGLMIAPVKSVSAMT